MSTVKNTRAGVNFRNVSRISAALKKVSKSYFTDIYLCTKQNVDLMIIIIIVK